MGKPPLKRAFKKGAESKIPFSFVKAFQEGKTYIYPAHGPVLYKGVEDFEIAGVGESRVMVFWEMYPEGRTANILRVPEDKIDKIGIRHLLNAATMDKLVKVMESSDGKGFRFQGMRQMRDLYKQGVVSSDPNVLCEMVCKTLGVKEKGNMAYQSRSDNAQRSGEAALRLLACEFAIVKAVSLYEALDILSQKSGKYGRPEWKNVTGGAALRAVNG